MKKTIVIVASLLIIFTIALIYNRSSIRKNMGVSLIDEADIVIDNTNNSTALTALANKVKDNTKGLYTLINKAHSLSTDYVPDNLVVPNINLVGHAYEERSKVSKIMVEDLESMFSDAKAEGLDLFLLCGYRSYSTQQALYHENLQSTGKNHSNSVAIAGNSEHQLGLGIDLTTQSLDFKLSQEFENTREGAWIGKNAHKYGFIIRYPKEKEHITGFIYEPWHLRYIGDMDLTTYCYENKLTLEEIYSTLGI